ncbi:hypothetical protein [Cetobacterium sp.]|uniref:hypothetical protein n=1 Tax=Cetobacterium sp. TaxID=2071632 RepID=UPI003EE7B897
MKSFPVKNGGIIDSRIPKETSLCDVISIIKDYVKNPNLCEWRKKCSICKEIKKNV